MGVSEYGENTTEGTRTPGGTPEYAKNNERGSNYAETAVVQYQMEVLEYWKNTLEGWTNHQKT